MVFLGVSKELQKIFYYLHLIVIVFISNRSFLWGVLCQINSVYLHIKNVYYGF